MTAAVVIFGRANTIGSAAIRLAQGWADWSHACGLMPGGDVVEALAARGHVVSTPLPEMLARCSRYEALAIEVPRYSAWVDAQRARIGRRYGYLDALGAWLGTRRLDHPQRDYCSQAVADDLHGPAGLDILCPSTRGVLPWALYRLMWAAGARPVDLSCIGA